MDTAELNAALERLTDVLVRQDHLWRPRPFAVRPAPWESSEPELATWLSTLPEPLVDALEANPWSHPVHPRFAALRDEAASAAQVGTDFGAEPVETPRAANWRMPARKRDQARALAAVLEPLATATPRFVDWCGGKGHLSRLFALRTGGRATVVDRDRSLLEAGARLHARARLETDWYEADVLQDAAGNLRELIDGQDLAIGLHSCGALTDALIEHVIESDVPLHASAPCCPHVVRDASGFRARSARGRALTRDNSSVLVFDRIALRLAIADEVVARAADRRTRRREMAWRLGADDLIRAVEGTQHYDSLGNISTADFRRSFGDFCRWALSRRGHDLPMTFDAAAAEAAAWQTLHRVRATALVRALYRRALETWIIVDKALWITESGRPVSLGRFCPRATTPRNLLIVSTSPARA